MGTLSDLFHNSSFSMTIWGAVGFVAGFWHTFYPFRMRELKEDELEKISPRFRGVNGQIVQYMIVWFVFVLILMFLKLDDWALSKYGVRFYPFIEIVLAGYGLFQALFAFEKGVYPQAKSLSYVYGDEKKIRHVAIVQIYISVGATILSILIFHVLATSLH